MPTPQELLEAYKIKGNLSTEQIMGKQALPTIPSVSTTGTKSPVPIISTSQAIPKLNEATTAQANDVANLEERKKTEIANAEAKQKKTEENIRKSGGLTMEEIGAIGGDITQYEWARNGTNLYTPKQSTQNTNTILDEDEQAINTAYDNAQSIYVDAPTSALIESIRNQFAGLITEAKDMNMRSEAQTQTTGIRSGTARYVSGVAQGILNEESRAGLARITDITSQMFSAIASAENARSEKSYDLFVKKRQEINALKSEQLKELQTQQAELKKQKDALNEKKIQANIDMSIADLYNKGTTDQAIILNTLNKQGLVVSAKQVKEALETIAPEIYSSIANEYNLYKKDAISRGLTPISFNDYQTQDANRKISIAQAAITAGGLTSQQTQNFLRISDKFQADEVMKTAGKAKTAITIANQVIANPKSAGNQLTILYTLVKNLDPDSAVREGELALAQQAQSYLGKYKTTLERVSEGKLIDDKTTKELALATKQLAQMWYEAGQRKEKQYKSQANTAGVGKAFNEYLGGYDRPYDEVNNNLIQGEEEAKQSVINFGANNTGQQNLIKSLVSENQPELGRPMTYSEVIEYLKANGFSI